MISIKDNRLINVKSTNMISSHKSRQDKGVDCCAGTGAFSSVPTYTINPTEFEERLSKISDEMINKFEHIID